MEQERKKKIIEYPEKWHRLLIELKDENTTNVNHEIRQAIKKHLVQNNKL